MATSATTGVRRSLADIQADYDAGNKTELETLMRAWKGIKELPPGDPNSFFMLGGYHGEPFRGQGATDPSWWGGYCQHGTVLFPSWHRIYLWQLEKALQSVPGCAGVTLPFWDECSPDSTTNGIPSALTDEYFTLDGAQIPNPLRSFVLPVDINDQVQGDNSLYSKPAGYETVRYPLSGLVGTPQDRQATDAHNAQFPDYGANVGYLNGNIVAWLTTLIPVGGYMVGEIYNKFVKCLNAPNYTLFSNTTSQGAWNKANPKNLVTCLENPHNSMHLAVGGFDVPGQGDFSPIAGANGDMGENDTAGLDPIFFFHHCFIDYAFWTWQRKHGATDSFTIDPNDPGAAYNSSVNPPPAGANPADKMSMTTPLDPFVNPDTGATFTTNDAVNIETQLGYSYGPGSLDRFANVNLSRQAMLAAAPSPEPAARTVHIEGIDRSKIRGSFLIEAYATIDGEEKLIGRDAVLSRWHVGGCANCLAHLKVGTDFRLPSAGAEEGGIRVEVRTREGPLRALRRPIGPAAAVMAESLVATEESNQLTGDARANAAAYTVEVVG
jgi:tyrosinase